MSSEKPSDAIAPTEESSQESSSIEASIEPEPAFGWNAYAERVNGRFAMIGIVVLLVMEFFTHQDFYTWVGLR